MKRLLFIALSLASTSALDATPLWNGAESGMSVLQVTKKFEGAAVPKKPSELANGATEKIQIPSIKYLNHEFLVRFYFNDAGLEQVTLALKNPGKRKELTQIAELIAKDLSKTLGQAKQQASDDSGAKTLGWIWDRPEQRVSIFMISFGPTEELSDGGFLNVNYQSPVKSPSNSGR